MAQKKIAILGGGMGGLSVAFELTRRPDLRRDHDVTVYQQGFLLGGKGASVRNLEEHARIEEHGLHIWLGFYENAFALIRACYEELGRPPEKPLATWRDAFLPHDFLVVMEQARGRWIPWHFDFPRNGAAPGDGAEPPGAGDYAVRILQWLLTVLADWNRTEERKYPGRSARLAEMAKSLELVIHAWEIVAAATNLSMGTLARHGAALLEGTRPRPEDDRLLRW